MTPHFRDEGEGSPIVLLHGLGASARVFDPLFEKRVYRRLISVDLPRTARSGHWASSTPEHISAALLDFLDTRKVKAFELFGHSFGGLVALHLAATTPSRVTKLTVASTPALGVPPEFKLLLANPLADMTMGWFGKMPIWRPALKSYLQMIWGPSANLNDEHLALYEEALGAPGFSEGMLEALRAVAAFRTPVEALRSATFEKRVLWGEKDRLVSVVQGEQLALSIGAKLTVLHDVGHCLPEEAPEALHEFLTAS
ncbi:MAG: alpha/beta hydrolase [Archangium sp.]|nr:alpha/beta hydrolase [Archangium sp.]